MKMSSLHLHGGSKLKSPYNGCRKWFERPTLLTDLSTTPRKSSYACPHCVSKIDVNSEVSRL